VYGKCLGIDLGSVEKPHSDPAWAEEGLISCIEVDCGSYDASTNAITHKTNIALQRRIFGEHYFIDALDSRKEAKLVGDNKFQTLKATARFQMLSGHPDTTFGNTVSNLTEMVASLFHSYPELLRNAEVSDIKVESSSRWFELAAKMTGGDDKQAFKKRELKGGCHPYLFHVKTPVHRVNYARGTSRWSPGHTEVSHVRYPKQSRARAATRYTYQVLMERAATPIVPVLEFAVPPLPEVVVIDETPVAAPISPIVEAQEEFDDLFGGIGLLFEETPLAAEPALAEPAALQGDDTTMIEVEEIEVAIQPALFDPTPILLQTPPPAVMD